MEPHVLRALLVDNAWLEGADLATWLGRMLPTDYVPRSLRLDAEREACLVVGPRQVGKSTLIWKTLADAREPVLFVNCEEPAMQEWLRSPATFVADLEELAPGARSLFFEEAQHLDDAGLLVKGLVDRRIGRRIYATGSSAFDLQARTRESLAGRARRHLLLPFALDELAASSAAPPILAHKRRTEIVRALLVYGGYPTVWASRAKERELGGLVEAFVVRDASDRFRIRNVPAFRKLLRLMASQAGSLCNYSEWGALCGVSNDTVAQHVGLLEDSHLVRLVAPFVGGKRAELTKTPKVYFLDNGVRNALFGGFAPIDERPDRGALVEGFVLGELCRNTNPLLDTVRYWRSTSGAEVDFILEHGDRLLGVEVKAGDARGILSRSARSFADAYSPDLFLVVSEAAAPDREQGATPIRFVRPESVAGEIRAFVGTS
jgi:predicted AAA+ superfamily ATPase